MKLGWAILLMAFILAIPIFMYWWNSKRKVVEITDIKDIETPVLGRYKI